uniref:Uncharacterized protein n=1 Tax=Glossina palpalis gambiensis TaxID=67801 RepID=A0A1B0BK58_9MUSC
MPRWMANKLRPNDSTENSTYNLCTTLNDAMAPSFAIRTQKQTVSSDIPHKMLKLGNCAHIDMGLIDFSFNGVFRVTYFLINSKTTWEIIFLKYFIFIVSLPRPVNSSEMTCINTGPYAYISVIKIFVGFHLNLCSKSIVLLEELNNEQVDKISFINSPIVDIQCTHYSRYRILKT